MMQHRPHMLQLRPVAAKKEINTLKKNLETKVQDNMASQVNSIKHLRCRKSFQQNSTHIFDKNSPESGN